MLRTGLLLRTLVEVQPKVAGTVQAKRNFNLHEYQSQDLMKKFGIAVPDGYVAGTPDEVKAAAAKLDTEDLIVKAQVLSGGRGKGHFTNGFQSGVHIVRTPEEAAEKAGKMLGEKLITKQNADGLPCEKVLIARREYIRREMYLAILLDRETAGPVLVASEAGGMNIEEVAEANPDAIYKLPLPASTLEKGIHLPREPLLKVAENLGFTPGQKQEECADLIDKLYTLFKETDCTMMEINPLAENVDGRLLCTDAKLNFDANAAYRQEELFKQVDQSQQDPREVEASKFDLNYIGLDGNIGCLVNGAGLAMATMDVIKLAGGNPANFLDIGGGATDKQVQEALRIISSDSKVEAILINIFGGIMRCDVIALGLINACTALNLRVPLVVRLRGTNVEKGKEMLEASGLRIIPADDLDEAAAKAVHVAAITKLARESNLTVSFELPM